LTIWRFSARRLSYDPLGAGVVDVVFLGAVFSAGGPVGACVAVVVVLTTVCVKFVDGVGDVGAGGGVNVAGVDVGVGKVMIEEGVNSGIENSGIVTIVGAAGAGAGVGTGMGGSVADGTVTIAVAGFVDGAEGAGAGAARCGFRRVRR